MKHVTKTTFRIAVFMAAALIIGLLPSVAAATNEQNAGAEDQNLWVPFLHAPGINIGFGEWPIESGTEGLGPTANFGWTKDVPFGFGNFEGYEWMDANGDGKITADDFALLDLNGETLDSIGEYLMINGENGSCSIGDYVWFDIDKDGIQDADENGINGVTVELYNWTFERIKEATTVTASRNGKDGWYSFDNLPDGLYRVKFLPDSSYYNFSRYDAGRDDSLDSDADPSDGTSPWRLHASYFNKDDSSIDAGLMPKTDGISPAVFYSAGSGLMLAGSMGIASPWLAARRKRCGK